MACRAIDFGIAVWAPDYLLSAVRLQIFLTFIASLYDARHNIVLVLSSICKIESLNSYEAKLYCFCRMCPLNNESHGEFIRA